MMRDDVHDYERGTTVMTLHRATGKQHCIEHSTCSREEALRNYQRWIRRTGDMNSITGSWFFDYPTILT